MATRKKSYKIAPLELAVPRTSTAWLDEPNLLFAGGRQHPDPKTGIPLYGPRSLGSSRHKQEIHVGFIGTSESVDHAQQFYRSCCEGIAGDDDHAPFPGCQSDRGFRCDLRMDQSLVELISRQESQQILGIKKSRERFENLLQLLHQKMLLLTQRDHPLDYVVLVLPQDLYLKCRTTNYMEKGRSFHRDLRLAFKAMAMQFEKPTQILLESTTGLTDSRRRLDHESVIAWNLFTGMYFKIDGLPWGPTGLPPASCYIGVSFFRPLGESSTLRTRSFRRLMKMAMASSCEGTASSGTTAKMGGRLTCQASWRTNLSRWCLLVTKSSVSNCHSGSSFRRLPDSSRTS